MGRSHLLREQLPKCAQLPEGRRRVIAKVPFSKDSKPHQTVIAVLGKKSEI